MDDSQETLRAGETEIEHSKVTISRPPVAVAEWVRYLFVRSGTWFQPAIWITPGGVRARALLSYWGWRAGWSRHKSACRSGLDM